MNTTMIGAQFIDIQDNSRVSGGGKFDDTSSFKDDWSDVSDEDETW